MAHIQQGQGLRNFSALRLLRESFLPVVLVFAALFAFLAFVRFKAAFDADQGTVIRIESMADAEADGDDGGRQEELRFSLERSEDPRVVEARRLANEGRLKEAEAAYRGILAQGASSQAYNDLGVILWKKDDSKKALEMLSRALDTEPVYALAYLNRGLVLANQGQYAEAIVAYQALLEHIPHHFGTRFNLGVAQMRMEDIPAAIGTFEEAVTLAGGHRRAKAYYNLGLAYSRADPPDLPAARAAMLQALRLRPDYIAARLRLAEGEPDSAEGQKAALAEYKKIVGLRPDHAQAHFRIGAILSAQGEREAAIESYRKAVRYTPTDIAARYNLGLLLLAAKQWQAAETQFGAILRQEPKHAKSHFSLGRTAFGLKDYVRAKTHYQEAFDLREGKYPEAAFNLGLVAMAQKQPAQAKSYYQKALDLKPHYPQAWLNLGIVAMREKNWDEARAAFRQALAQRPRYAQAWFNLGVTATRQNREEDAIRAYREALGIRPEYTAAQLNLAVRLANRGDHAEAVRIYRDVLARDETYASAWLNLGLAHMELKDFPAAQEALTRALELEPESVKARRFLGRSHILAGDFDQGLPLLEAAVDMLPTNSFIRLELALALKSAGRHEAARLQLKKGLALKPNHRRLKRELDQYERTGN